MLVSRGVLREGLALRRRVGDLLEVELGGGDGVALLDVEARGRNLDVLGALQLSDTRRGRGQMGREVAFILMFKVD